MSYRAEQYSHFHEQVVKAIMNGSMEQKVLWMSGECISLHKRIKYHQEALAKKYDPDLKVRLDEYQILLDNFTAAEFKKSYVTSIKMLYSSDMAPSLIFSEYNKNYLNKEVSVDVKFWINFEGKKKLKWEVENSSGLITNRNVYSKYSYSCHAIEQVPNILFTLPSLITEDCLVKKLEDFKRYIYDFRNE